MNIKKIIVGAVILAAVLLAGIKFSATNSVQDTPQAQEQVQSIEETQAPAPLIRKDTYTISSESPPHITWASFDPLDYGKGETQTVAVKIENAIPVESVRVTMITDNREKTHELALIEGTPEKGTWQGDWIAEGVNDYHYQAAIEAESATESSRVVVSFR